MNIEQKDISPTRKSILAHFTADEVSAEVSRPFEQDIALLPRALGRLRDHAEPHHGQSHAGVLARQPRCERINHGCIHSIRHSQARQQQVRL